MKLADAILENDADKIAYCKEKITEKSFHLAILQQSLQALWN